MDAGEATQPTRCRSGQGYICRGGGFFKRYKLKLLFILNDRDDHNRPGRGNKNGCDNYRFGKCLLLAWM